MTPRRNCVFVALSNAVGHELVFRHHTKKVVVGNYQAEVKPDFKTTNSTEKKKGRT